MIEIIFFYFVIGSMGMEHDGQTVESKIGPFFDLASCEQVLKDYQHNYFVISGCLPVQWQTGLPMQGMQTDRTEER